MDMKGVKREVQLAMHSYGHLLTSKFHCVQSGLLPGSEYSSAAIVFCII